MTTLPQPPCIPSNPDISGIGVRAAIYIQNLLGFIPVISALWEGQVAEYELEAVETQSNTMLITAFGMLISAAVQAQTELGLSIFHTNIILALSWMCSANTFIYLLLYAQRRSQFGSGLVWEDLVQRRWFGKKQRNECKEDSTVDDPRSILQTIFRVQLSGFATITILGSLHLSVMSAVGLWLWSNPRVFGNPQEVDQCALIYTSLVILGVPVPLRSESLRIASLVVYSIFVVPGLNLMIPMAFFLCGALSYRAFHGHTWRLHLEGSQKRLVRILSALRSNPFLLPTFTALLFLLAITTAFAGIVELTLRYNEPFELPGQGVWSFGQVLAVTLLVLPLRDLRVFGAKRGYTTQLTNVVRSARADAAVVVRDLVMKGADVNVWVSDSTYLTALHLAVSHLRDTELVHMLLVYGAQPNVQDATGFTALHTAVTHGDLPIARLLLSHGADPNIQGERQTALGIAAHAGNTQMVRLLLEHGADSGESPYSGNNGIDFCSQRTRGGVECWPS
ncbi:hypothetical protein FB45DRAFT_368446 [Roridomyces roridus]|uniref:Uncharacterized protein n=1 Tax=Roridomyces roridus TaxID=1738132 RepID=A0AAD7B3L7_9AGAR|nr:hypothetical protein FB45DRAFT_368446 [Roridomyces roridus]